MLKFIITDPCYIFNDDQYKAIGEAVGWGKFEKMRVPATLFIDTESATYNARKDAHEEIVVHSIKGTPNGDGSYDYRGQSIGVDSGMLCVAENKKGWVAEEYGARFATLEEALKAFPSILRHF